MSVTAEEREQLLRTLRKGGPMTDHEAAMEWAGSRVNPDDWDEYNLARAYLELAQNETQDNIRYGNVELCPKCSKAQKVIARLHKLLVRAEEALKREEITNRRSMPVTMPPRDSP